MLVDFFIVAGFAVDFFRALWRVTGFEFIGTIVFMDMVFLVTHAGATVEPWW